MGLHHSFAGPLFPSCPSYLPFPEGSLHLPTPLLCSHTLARPKPGRGALGVGNHSQNYQKSSGDPHVTRRSALLAKLGQGCDRVPWDTSQEQMRTDGLRFGIWEGRKT